MGGWRYWVSRDVGGQAKTAGMFRQTNGKDTVGSLGMNLR
jgi:hypothetical protein